MGILKIHSDKLCLLIGVCSSLPFHDVIDKVTLRAAILLLVSTCGKDLKVLVTLITIFLQSDKTVLLYNEALQ